MPTVAIIAIAVFGVLFITWVILPTILRKRHAGKTVGEAETEE